MGRNVSEVRAGPEEVEFLGKASLTLFGSGEVPVLSGNILNMTRPVAGYFGHVNGDAVIGRLV